MKQLRTQLRLLLAERLLAWVFNIAPAEHEGATLRICIKRYFEYAAKETAKEISNGE